MERKEEGQIYMDGRVKNKKPDQENWAGMESRRGGKTKEGNALEARRGKETREA